MTSFFPWLGRKEQRKAMDDRCEQVVGAPNYTRETKRADTAGPARYPARTSEPLRQHSTGSSGHGSLRGLASLRGSNAIEVIHHKCHKTPRYCSVRFESLFHKCHNIAHLAACPSTLRRDLPLVAKRVVVVAEVWERLRALVRGRGVARSDSLALDLKAFG